VVRPLGGARDGSAVVLADVDGKTLAYVADEDDARIRVVDVDEGLELSSVRPGGVPSQLALRGDGKLVAALRDVSQVVVLGGGGTSASPLAVEQRLDVATEPVGIALAPGDATLVVTSAWGRTVSIVDARAMRIRAEHAVAREPRAVVVSTDGKRAFVSHVVGDALDVVSLDEDASAGAVRQLRVGGAELTFGRSASPSTGTRAACQGFALARAESGRVFAPHVLAFTGNAEETSSGYGGDGEGRDSEVFHVPVIDEDAATIVAGSMRVTDTMVELPNRCALPRSATVGKAGLFVTCLGEDVVSLYDARAVNPHDVELARWKVPSGPIGVAVDDAHGRAVVWSQLAHALTTLATGDGDQPRRPFALSSTTLPRQTRLSAKVERGRALFHATDETRISGDGRACASCHPDGRDDALVWSSPNGPRQTPMLAGRLGGAAPYGWNGDAVDVSTHLTQTFKRLGGRGVTGDDKEALIAYVSSLAPPPKGRPKDPAAVARGKEIFVSAKTECASCHGAAGELPDGARHDVKSRAAGDARGGFDTPSLKLVGGSGPWFHDGRYKDLRTLLVKSDGKMGHTKHLSPSELSDLTLYLESL